MRSHYNIENTEQDRKYITLAFTPLIMAPALVVFTLLVFLSMSIENITYYMVAVFILCTILLFASAMGYKQIINKSKSTRKSYRILIVLNVLIIALALFYELLPLFGGGDLGQ